MSNLSFFTKASARYNFLKLGLFFGAIHLGGCPSTTPGSSSPLSPQDFRLFKDSSHFAYESDNLYVVINRSIAVQWTNTTAATPVSTEIRRYTEAGCKTGTNGAPLETLAASITKYVKENQPEGYYYLGVNHVFQDGTKSPVACFPKALVVDRTPPTAPSEFKINNTLLSGTSPVNLTESGVNLKWKLSTDAVWMHSYFIAFYSGSTCSNQIGMVSQYISQNDAGDGVQLRLPVGTSYIGITAYDRAGNSAKTCSPTPVVAPNVSGVACKTVRQDAASGTTPVNIVMIASGYRGNLSAFRSDVERLETGIRNHSVYRQSLGLLNFYYVDKEHPTTNDFCSANGGILGCDYLPLEYLSQECQVGPSVKIVLVNSSNSLLRSSTSGHTVNLLASDPTFAAIAAHELGHGIFYLGDEYVLGNTGSNADNSPNCDYDAGQSGHALACEKWRDLLNDSRFHDVFCTPGRCAQGDYMAPAPNTIMNNQMLGATFMSVNERIACCAYKDIAGIYPAGLCDKFKDVGGAGGLDAYCAKQSPIHLSKMEFLSHPLELEFGLDSSGAWKFMHETKLSAGNYSTEHTQGDLGLSSKRRYPKSEAVNVDTETFDSKGKSIVRTLQFSKAEKVEVFAKNSSGKRWIESTRSTRKVIRMIINDPNAGPGPGKSRKSKVKPVIKISGRTVY